MAQDFKYKLEQSKNGDTEVKVSVESSRYQSASDTAYEQLKSKVKMPGFRAGKAPRAMVESRLGVELVQRAIELLTSDIAEEILETENLFPLTRLEYDLGSIDKDKGVEFSFVFAAYPKVEIADIKKLKAKKQEAKVEDAEIDEVIQNLFTDSYRAQQMSKDESEDDKDAAKKSEIDPKEVLDWVDDKKVADLGIEEVDTVAKLRARIKEQLQQSRENEVYEKLQQDLVLDLIKQSDFELPQRLVDQEVENSEQQYRSRVKELDMDVETFLAAQGTSLDELRKEWAAQARERFGRELVLSEVAKKYELLPAPEELDAEISSITDPKTRKQLDTASGRRYIASVMIQQRALGKILAETGHAEAQK